MARPVWTGAVAFGLVNVPVALYTATEDRTVTSRARSAGKAAPRAKSSPRRKAG